MATINLTADIDISLTALEAAALRCTRSSVRLSSTLTPEQIADAFFLLNTSERAAMFVSLARKSLSQAKGWDATVDEILSDPLVTRAEVGIIDAPASHPTHNIRPGDLVRIDVNCEHAITGAAFLINNTAVVARLDSTGLKLIFANGIILDATAVTQL